MVSVGLLEEIHMKSSIKCDLLEHDRFVCIGEMLVVSTLERRTTLEQSKLSVYWPGAANDLTQFIASCSVCVKFWTLAALILRNYRYHGIQVNNGLILL